MVIRASSASEIRALVAALGLNDEVAREAAAARLAVIGPRVIPHLLAAYEHAQNRTARLAILRAMEPVADPRTLPVSTAAIRDGADIALAAIAVLRQLTESPHGATADEALEALVSAAIDKSTERRVRLAAIEAVAGISEGVRGRLQAALSQDPDQWIRARVSAAGSRSSIDADAAWRDALEGRLPDDPSAMRESFVAKAGGAPLGEVQALVDRVRAREIECETAAAEGWLSLRGALHQALALRGSRVALYDLRETLETAAARLPASFVSAAQAIGDASCLEALASAFSQTQKNDRRRHAMAAAFRSIAAREKPARRNAMLKRIRSKWPESGAQLIGNA
jgi:hypothetical protein